MFKISATLIIAAIAGSALVSNAEAHGTGQFLTSYAYRMQGRPHESRRDFFQQQREIAYAEECERQRQIAAARAKAAAAERARLLAIKQAQAKAQAKAQLVAASANEAASAPVAKKGDLQDVATAVETTATKTASAAPATCRKYSPTTASMVETACE